MNNRFFCIVLFLGATTAFSAIADSKIEILGSSKKVIEVSPETSTGLNNIFVVFDTNNCRLSFKASNGYTATVSKYSNLGGGYAEELKDVDRSSSEISFPLSSSDMGYIFNDNGSSYYCWIVNYANHFMTLESVEPSEQQDCSYSILDIDGEASPITYYTINGQPRVLSREINVQYTTQEFDSESAGYKNVQERKVYESIGSTLSISPPAYCSTYFAVSGDRFLTQWDMEIYKESGVLQPIAVECSTEAIQEYNEGDDGSNVMSGGDKNGLGGSAPARISFYAYTTDGVIHNEWQMSRDQNFENPEYRFYQKDLDYEFTDEGTFFLRYIGSNAEGTCETFGDVYTVTIGSSALECPNAFSPNGDGVNDMWKVSYRSLIEFNCEIFNRNGQKIYGFNEPSGGWDGTWNGKLVKPGVYYYVITATGADGVKYKKSGDINIINSVNLNNNTIK